MSRVLVVTDRLSDSAASALRSAWEAAVAPVNAPRLDGLDRRTRRMVVEHHAEWRDRLELSVLLELVKAEHDDSSEYCESVRRCCAELARARCVGRFGWVPDRYLQPSWVYR